MGSRPTCVWACSVRRWPANWCGCRAATRTAVDPRLSADGARIQRQFQQFERSAAGLCRVLPDATGLALADDDVGVLAGHTAAVLAAGERAVARLRRLRAKVALRGGCDA